MNLDSDDATVVAAIRHAARSFMASRNLTERVEVLEMKTGSLEELPARMSAVESQLMQLRTEIHGEFSAVRTEMRALNEETKTQMLMLHEEVLDRIPDADVKAALESLPENFRLPVLLADVEGFSYKEIADIMGSPIGTVMSRLHRGRKALEKALWETARERGLVDGDERNDGRS